MPRPKVENRWWRTYRVTYEAKYESTIRAVEQSKDLFHDDRERIFPNHWSLEESCTMGGNSWVKFENSDGEDFKLEELVEVHRKISLLDAAFEAMTKGTAAAPKGKSDEDDGPF